MNTEIFANGPSKHATKITDEIWVGCCKQRWTWTRDNFLRTNVINSLCLFLNLGVSSLLKQKLGKGRTHYMKFPNQLRAKSWPTIYKKWGNAWYRLIMTVQVRPTFINRAHQPATNLWLTMKKWQKQPYNGALSAGVTRQAGNSANMSIWSKRGNAIVCWLHRAERFLAERTRKAWTVAVRS